MKTCITRVLGFAALALAASTASAETLTFTKLTGVTGGTPTGTAVYRADLSSLSLSSILKITIQDNSGGIGGATGQLSGFDLDAVIISSTSVATAAAAQGLAGLGVFNYSAPGTAFTPGTQRPTVEPKLFGTDGGGLQVDNAVATLGAFDGNSTIVIPAAFGFLSMGDGGKLTLNLTSEVATAGHFLYIGEVGDNGEIAAVVTVALPEPASILLATLGFAGVAAWGWRRRGR